LFVDQIHFKVMIQMMSPTLFLRKQEDSIPSTVPKKRAMPFFLMLFMLCLGSAQNKKAQNPIIFADVPDMSMVRVGNNYYMSSTTMHMSPGVPIMKSTDLVNWKLVNYAYDTLADLDALTLNNGKSAYGRGSWA